MMVIQFVLYMSVWVRICVVLLGRIEAYGLLFLPTPKHRNPFAFPIN